MSAPVDTCARCGRAYPRDGECDHGGVRAALAAIGVTFRAGTASVARHAAPLGRGDTPEVAAWRLADRLRAIAVEIERATRRPADPAACGLEVSIFRADDGAPVVQIDGAPEGDPDCATVRVYLNDGYACAWIPPGSLGYGGGS